MKARILFGCFFLVLFFGCSHRKSFVKTEYNDIDISYFDHDQHIDSILSPYKILVRTTMDEVINTAPKAMIKDQPESELGNFVCDLSMETIKKNMPNVSIDICIFNNGGFRAPLPSGDITKGNIYELMPFENELVLLTIAGNKINELAKYIAFSGGQPVAGIKLGIKDKMPIDFLINNLPADTNRTYQILTSDYLAQGGDKMTFFNNPIEVIKTNLKMRDAILNYVIELKKNNHLVESKLDGRVYNK